MGLAQRAGARYVVPTTKHHDGFCLGDSATTPFHAAGRGSGRDLIAEFSPAIREIAQVPEEMATGGRVTLAPGEGEQTVAVVTLPRR